MSAEQEQLVDVLMPALGMSVAEGTIVAWRHAVGEQVGDGEAICDISTDKIAADLPAPASGRLVEILVAAGETVESGAVIARIAALGALPATPARHSPAVERLAAEHGVDLSSLLGSGEGGRIRREDVLAAARGGGGGPYVAPAPSALSLIRRTIGAHMKRSLDTAATVTSWIEVDFAAVEQARRELRVTALPIVAALTVATLAEYPDLNAWLEDGERFVRHETVNLGIAVALGGEGLIVPVIRDAQRLELAELAERIRTLAAAARGGELTAAEVHGGTFTITNPGQWGTVAATPVLNEPQVAILDLEAIVKRPVVRSGPDGEDAVVIRPIALLGLSWDHRALDGAYAAQFLAALRARIESYSYS
jgi:pyruvate/2-oxoglutarate dehydrogenase complex dihydrolipoamide acyltransferase (E2) component